jgi:hypothetical protein
MCNECISSGVIDGEQIFVVLFSPLFPDHFKYLISGLMGSNEFPDFILPAGNRKTTFAAK